MAHHTDSPLVLCSSVSLHIMANSWAIIVMTAHWGCTSWWSGRGSDSLALVRFASSVRSDAFQEVLVRGNKLTSRARRIAASFSMYIVS